MKDILIAEFEEIVNTFPDKTAIEEEGQHVAYQELNARSNRLAWALRSIDVKHESIVSVIIPSSVSLVASLLGILKAGGIYLPVDLAFAGKRIAQIFDQTQCEIIITTTALKDAVSELIVSLQLKVKYVLVLDNKGALCDYIYNGITAAPLDGDISNKNPDIKNLPEDSCYIFYTSGSTGEAKAFLGMHRSLHHFIAWEKKEFNIDHHIRVSQLTQITFDASLRDIFVPLTCGGTLCIPPAGYRSNFVQLVNWIAESRIHLIHCVPSVFRLLIKEISTSPVKIKYFPSLKHVLMAGEILYGRDVQNWYEAVGDHVEIVNLYGTSETTLAKTFHRIKEVPEDPSMAIHAGQPIEGAFIAIINSTGKLCRIGEIGEIYIKTPHTTKGYYKNEVLTRKVFVQNPLTKEKDIIYKTGDLGRYLADRNVEVLGRLDDQVKINGIRVELNEIKQAVLGKDGINEAFITTHKNRESQHELICYYVGNKIDIASLRSFLQTELNESLIPSYFIPMEELPLTLNGKVDKKALPMPDNLIISDEDYEAPQGTLECTLEEIYKEVLGLKRVGRKVSFFSIGGTSLKAMQVISRIYKTLDISLKIADIFSNPTVANLAEVVTISQQKAYQAIEPLAPQEYYELSHAQQRLWILDKLDQQQATYNMSAAVELTGELNKDAFAAALETLVARHESLRTIFITIDGAPKQKILDTAAALSGLQYEVAEAASIRQYIAAEAGTPFNLATGPLFRTRLLQVDATKHVFIYTLHHIITDGWSMEVLINELITLYNAYSKNTANPLSPLAIQYKDYAAWQHALLGNGGMDTSREYWLQQFNETVPVLELPVDKPRPATKTFNGEHIRFQLDSQLTLELKALAEKHTASLYMTLLAAVYTLLHRYTGQEDIVIGAPVSGREMEELENQIGFFVNTLALRTQCDSRDNFSTLLQKIKQTTVNGYTHQHYPFDQLVEELPLERDLSKHVLFDVMVALQNISLSTLGTSAIAGITATPLLADTPTSKFDLLFNFNEHEEQLHGYIQYNTDLFDATRINTMISHLKNIITVVVQTPEVPLGELNYISLKEKEQLLFSFNDTTVAYPDNKTLTDLFEEQVLLRTDSPAIIFEDRVLSYRQLNEKSNQLAHYLMQNHDVQPGDLIVLMLERSEWMAITIMAILKCGAAYVPVDPAYPAERKQYILEDTQAGVLITDAASEQYATVATLTVVTLQELLPVCSNTNPALPVRVEQLAYIIYTSGSTGQPKGVMLAHQGVVNRIHWMKRQYNFTPGEVVLQKTPYVFDVSVWEFFMTLCYGGTLLACHKDVIYDPALLVNIVEQYQVTHIHFVPGMFGVFLHALDEEKAKRLQSLRNIYCSGEALKPEHVKLHHALLHCDLNNLYGPTEASVDVSYYKTHAGDTIVPIGKPIDNIQLYILDKQLQLLPVGVPGELYIGGVGLAKGYLNKSALTAERFIDNPYISGGKIYKTGDVARWLPDGNIEYSGRSDFQVKIRGFRIELGEIENTLQQYQHMGEVLVLAKDDADGNKYLAAYFTAAETPDQSMLRYFMKEKLPEYMIPAYFIQLDTFPVNTNGKIDRKALPDPALAAISTGEEYVAPRNETEAALLAIWEEVLGRNTIGVKDNFFETGGNSLSATKVIFSIAKQMSLNVELKSLFAHPTIEQLAVCIAGTAVSQYELITPVGPQPYYELSHAQKRLWVLDHFEENQVSYIIPEVYTLKGPLHVAAFEQSFATLIARHEILRTTFTTVDGEPVQVIHAAADHHFRMEYKDMNGASKEEALAYVQREARISFDLEQGPLLVAKLIRIDDEQYVFLFVMHHIIFDGWSISVMLDEIMALYNAYAAGKEDPLASLTIQYKDYAAWEGRQLAGAKAEKLRNYWISQFQGELPLLNLPLDYPRPPLLSSHGNVQKLHIDKTLYRAIKETGRRQGASLFTVLIAAVKALLYRYTGQEDIMIGFPVAGRDHHQLENQIGFYVNTMVIRTQFSGADSFDALLKKVNTLAVGGYDHQSYPFDKLVSELNLPRDMSRSPLFDVMVSMENAVTKLAAVPEATGIHVETSGADMNISKLDLSFDFFDEEESLILSLEYNTDLFKPERIANMLLHYTNVLKEISVNSEKSLDDIVLLSATEQHQLLELFNDTAAENPVQQGVLELFEEQVALHRDAVAVVYDDTSLTYEELNMQANQLAHYLLTRYQVQPDDRIGIMVQRSEKMLVYLLGIWKSGAAYVPIDPEYSEERIRYMIADSGMKILLTDHQQDSFIQTSSAVIINPELNEAEIHIYKATQPEVDIRHDQLAYVIYTSGSTGWPKGVMVEHGHLLNIALGWRSDYRLNEFEVHLLQMASISFDVFCGDVCRTLLNGGKMVIVPAGVRLDATALYQLMQQHRINIFESTPALVLPLMDYLHDNKLDVSFMQLLILGSDTCQISDYQRLQERFGNSMRIVNSYGTTETTIDASFYEAPATAWQVGNVPIGKPMRNTLYYILDKNRRLLPTGITGELYIGGAGVARGYLNRAVLTAERFMDNPFVKGGRLYKTGDMACWLPDGNVLFSGRTDLQVKLRGYRIELGEIESALREHPAITQVVVAMKGLSADDKLLIAYYSANEAMETGTLRAWLEQRLPDYMIPAAFMYLEALPLSVNGKVDYKALPDLTEWSSTTTYMPPRTELEIKLVGIWESVLGRSGIGIRDNFFEIGGHSLKATRVLSQLHKTLHVQTDLRTIFSHPTVEGLAAALEGLSHSTYTAIVPIAPQAVYELSHAQKRLWILDQLEEEQVAYNIPAAWELSGTLDLPAFTQALAAVVARHESLRTVFLDIDGVPKQRIQDASAFNFKLQYEDLRTSDNRESLAEMMTRAEAQTPFSLEQGPLLRARLLQLEDKRYIFLFTTHHIISDGWSMVVLVRELITGYQSYSRGESNPLSPLCIQYKDYAAWQQQQLSGTRVQAHQSYWLNKFSGTIPVLELYPDHLRPAIKTYNGYTTSFILDQQVHEQLTELGIQQGASLFIVLLAAVKALLYRYTGQTDIVIGSPVAGRDHNDLEGQVGFFVNTLPLRTSFDANDDFLALLHKVKETTLGAYDHQVYPFDRLVDDLDLSRDMSRSPLFDVMLILQNTDADDVSALKELSVKSYIINSGISKFDLSYNFTAIEKGLLVEIEYNTDLFSTARIESMAVHLQGLIKAILADTAQPVNRLEYLSSQEKQQLLYDFNPAPTASAAQSIISLFNEQVERNPDATAVIADAQSLTFRELDECTNQLAHYLRSKGVQEETLVPLCIERSFHMVIGILGILKAGGAYVPIAPDYPQSRITYMLEDTGASLILSSSKSRVVLQDLTSADIVSLDEAWPVINTQRTTALNTIPDPDHLAYIIYTSGSTGQPKGVMVAHRNAAALVSNIPARLGLQPGMKMGATTNYTFDISVLELLGVLAIGNTLFLVTDTDPLHILELIANNSIDALQVTPSRLHQLLELSGGNLEQWQHLKVLLVGGEAMSASLYEQLKKLGNTRAINVYGPTETTIWSTSLDIRESNELSVGTALYNESVYILDEHHQPVPAGVAGEICISGDGVTRGYLHRPDLTAQKFVADPFSKTAGARMYKTGDLGRWLPDGTIAYLRRMDDQVKIRGYRIELGEIEHALLQHPAISEAAVLAKKGQDEQLYLAAYFTATEETDLAALRSYLGTLLPEYMVPAGFVKMDAMPLNASGKLDRKALPDPVDATLIKGTTYMPPRTELETKLVEIWESVLGRSGIGIRDNFFEIGGHSLKATRVLSQLHKTLHVQTDLRTIFSHPTIEGLAAALEGLSQNIYTAIVPVAPQDVYELSHAQKRLWILDQLEEEQVAYNIPAAWELSGTLDLPAFTQALAAVVARHESLRTVFLDIDGVPKQRIQDASAFNFKLQYEDLRTSDNRESLAEMMTRAEAQTPFSLEQGPLLRARLLQLEDDRYIFLFTTHHIISDGWSMVVLVRELITGYQSYSRGESNPLSPLHIQYKDYAAWQQQQLSGTRVQAHQFYWLNKFSDTVPVLELYPDHLRPAIKTYNGHTASFVLDQQMHEQLNELGIQQGASLFIVLLAAVKALLYRYTGQTDIVIGSPVAGRDHNDLEEQVGFFVNTLPLRTSFDANDNFLALLHKVKETTLDAYDHQVYPFDRLVDDLDLGRDMSRSPLFDVMLILQHADAEDISTLEGLSVKGYGVDSGISKFDLSYNFTELETGLLVAIEYNTDLFDTIRIERMAGHLQKLLKAILADTANPVNRLEYLSSPEKQQLLYDFNDTIVPYSKDKTIHELFEEKAALLPARPALRLDGADITYEALNRKANQLAHYLLANGVKNGDNIGLITGRNFNMITAMYGIMKAGAAYVPIDPVYPADRQLYIMNNSGVSVVLVDEQYPVTAAADHIRYISLADENITACNGANPDIEKQTTDLAYTIYTSGSTGRPKGVMIAHHAAVNLIEWVNKTFRIDENDRLLFITSMCFDLSVYDIFGILAAGGTVVIARQEEVTDVERLQRLLLEEKITFWDSVPTTIHYLVNEIEESGGSYLQKDLRVVFMSGDWIPVSLPQKIKHYFPNARVTSLGGATEGTVWSNYYPIEEDMSGRVSVPYGKPIDNSFFYILDEHLNPVPHGVAGELYIGGAGVAEGYDNDEEKTAGSFVADPFSQALGGRMYRTGDLGRMLEDGNMEFMGRKDHQVKIRGFRIELGEIKNVLLQHSDIRETVVIAEEDRSFNKYLVAYIVAAETLNTATLREYVSQQLPEYMIPSCFITLEALPLSSNGKIDLKSLPRPDQAALHSTHEYIAPHTDLEMALASIWEEVLGKTRIGVNDNFFESGGHSLNATRVISRIAKTMQVKLDLKSIFIHPTIKAMAALISQSTSTGFEAITAVDIRDYYEVSHAQKRLWLLDQYDDDQTAYHISRALKISGQLDIPALQKAFESLLERHESLRTVFVPVQGIPMQQIQDPRKLHFKLAYSDLRLAEDKPATLKAAMDEVLRRPFDLANDLLLRVILFQLEETEYVFLMNQHHIISDGWSMEILTKECMAFYHYYTKGIPHQLAPLNIHYKDYTAWHNAQLSGDSEELHRQYWWKQFSGNVPVLKFPTDYARPAIKTYHGSELSFPLQADLAAKLRSIALSNGSSLFMTLLAAVKVLLYRFTEQEDIIVGSIHAGREHSDLENQIGFYVNTLALRTVLHHDDNFLQVLDKVKTTTLEAYAHQCYPFEQLVSELQLGSDKSRHPLFDIYVDLLNISTTPAQERVDDELQVAEWDITTTTSKYDLFFRFFDAGDDIVTTLEYNTDLFNPETIDFVKATFRRVVEYITGNPSALIGQVTLFENKQRGSDKITVADAFDFNF